MRAVNGRDITRGAARLAIDSLAAGAAIGLVESIRILGKLGGTGGFGDTARLVVIVTGLATLGSLLAGPIVLLLGMGAARVPVVRAQLAELRAGGAARVGVVARLAVIAAAAAGFAAIVFELARWAQKEFKEPRAIALLEGALITAVAIVVAVAAAELARFAAARAARLGPVVRALDGTRGFLILAGIAALGLIGAALVVAETARDVDLAAPYTLAGWVIVLAVFRALGFGRSRGAWGTAAVALGLVALAFGLLGSSEPARGAVSFHGVSSRRVIEALWATIDGDGDGYPPGWIGGADCDDGDADIAPNAIEEIDDGVDQNCTGDDLRAADVAHRTGPRPPGATGVPRRNVLIISIDALRADRLGAYGHTRPTSPAIDALAARSTRFDRAFTNSPTTRRAIPALLSGRYASTIAWRKGGKLRLQGSQVTTLAEVLKDAGYDTSAINCCKTLFGEKAGALEGFVNVDASADKTRNDRKQRHNGDAVADRVVKWLRSRRANEKPFLLWTHLIDVHHPYGIPEGKKFGTKAIDRYDTDITFADVQVGRMLEALRATGLDDDTIVILTSDHGEEFKEHGINFHAGSLFNQVARIPLIVHLPGAAPRVVTTPVSLADVMPTILDLVGVQAPTGMNGLSLAPAIRGTGDAPARPVLAELLPDYEIERNLIAVFDGDWKLIWDRDANAYQLYSLKDDLADKHDLVRARVDVFTEMKKKLQHAVDVELTPLPAGNGTGSAR